jgi:CRISPR-associated protein Csd2
MSLNKRYDFVLVFDVQDGNPNGDPDAGNLPRVDAETGNGLVTDVCLKRKIRNYVGLTKGMVTPYDIYVKEKAVLGRAHTTAFKDLGIGLGEESRVQIPQDILEELMDLTLPDGMTIEENDEGDGSSLIVASDADVKEIKAALKELRPTKSIKTFFEASIKGVKARKPKAEEVEQGRNWMCKNFYDIRTFGAVMSLKSAPNCGQVRGPVQLTFARSVEPVVALEHSITRMAVATEAEAEKQSGDNRTMGRKFTIPYGLYVAHGFVSAPLADQTGFSEDDLKLLWESLENMFEHDHSAARGMMATRGLYIFEHADKMGNAQAHDLFDRITIKRKDETKSARSFADYAVTINETGLNEKKVKLIRQVG